jgi:hypothetical protein
MLSLVFNSHHVTLFYSLFFILTLGLTISVPTASAQYSCQEILSVNTSQKNLPPISHHYSNKEIESWQLWISQNDPREAIYNPEGPGQFIYIPDLPRIYISADFVQLIGPRQPVNPIALFMADTHTSFYSDIYGERTPYNPAFEVLLRDPRTDFSKVTAGIPAVEIALFFAFNYNNTYYLDRILEVQPDIDLSYTDVGGLVPLYRYMHRLKSEYRPTPDQLRAFSILIDRTPNINWSGYHLGSTQAVEPPLLLAIRTANLEAMNLLLRRTDIDLFYSQSIEITGRDFVYHSPDLAMISMNGLGSNPEHGGNPQLDLILQAMAMRRQLRIPYLRSLRTFAEDMIPLDQQQRGQPMFGASLQTIDHYLQNRDLWPRAR